MIFKKKIFFSSNFQLEFFFLEFWIGNFFYFLTILTGKNLFIIIFHFFKIFLYSYKFLEIAIFEKFQKKIFPSFSKIFFFSQFSNFLSLFSETASKPPENCLKLEQIFPQIIGFSLQIQSWRRKVCCRNYARELGEMRGILRKMRGNSRKVDPESEIYFKNRI